MTPVPAYEALRNGVYFWRVPDGRQIACRCTASPSTLLALLFTWRRVASRRVAIEETREHSRYASTEQSGPIRAGRSVVESDRIGRIPLFPVCTLRLCPANISVLLLLLRYSFITSVFCSVLREEQ